MTHLAFLGTGLIGTGLAEAALARGDVVSVWNRTRAKAEGLAASGARLADSPADAARGAERIHVALSDDVAVDAVLQALGDAWTGVLVDHTTTSPAGDAARLEAAAAAGRRMVSAPVFMSPKMCRDAGGVMLVSGPEAVFAAVADGLSRMTGKVVYLGPSPRLAATKKLVGNAMIIGITAALADALALGRAQGLSPADVMDTFQVFNPANTLVYRGANMAKADFTPSFELSMARKDVRLMLEAAPGLLHLLPHVAARMDDLITQGRGGDDLGVLAVDAVG